MYYILILALVVWEIYWTVRACWLAAKNNDKGWFIFMLVFNLLGIPEIIYINKISNRVVLDDKNQKDQ
mgnify:CR=1 FL=1|tara:strand:- start:337 stop:540 length:204 start_codon:yes stop_codon:yes gene_type:complete